MYDLEQKVQTVCLNINQDGGFVERNCSTLFFLLVVSKIKQSNKPINNYNNIRGKMTATAKLIDSNNGEILLGTK